MAKAKKTKKSTGVRYNKNGEIVALDLKFTGSEPSWENVDKMSADEYQRNFERCLNFYSYYGNPEEYKNWLLEYLDKNPDFVSKSVVERLTGIVGTNIPGTLGKICRCFLRGMPTDHPKQPDKAVDKVKWLKNAILELCGSPEEKEQVSKYKVATAKQRLENKINERIMQPLMDFYEDVAKIDPEVNRIPTFDVSRLVEAERIPKGSVQPIIDWLQKWHDELDDSYTRADQQMVEGYSWMKRYQIKRVKEDLAKNIERLYAYTKKRPAKARTPRAQDPAKLVKNISLRDEVDGLKGIDPAKLVGAEVAYLYYPETRRLSVAYAQEGSTLTVKGKSIKNLDPERSGTFTLRKPDEILPFVTNKTKLMIEREIKKKVKTAKGKFSGRVNDKHLVLRTF